MGLKVLKKFQCLEKRKLYKPGDDYTPPNAAEQKKLVDAGYLTAPRPTKAEEAARVKSLKEAAAKKAEAKAEAEKAEADKKAAAEEKAAKAEADKAKPK